MNVSFLAIRVVIISVDLLEDNKSLRLTLGRQQHDTKEKGWLQDG